MKMWNRFERYWFAKEYEVLAENQRKELLKKLKETVGEILVKYEKIDKKLDFTDPLADTLCQRIECCFLHGLKEQKQSLKYTAIWKFIINIQSKMDINLFSQPQIETYAGKVRSWICYCLNNRTLEVILERLESVHYRYVNAFYESNALLLNHNDFYQFLNLVRALGIVNIQIELNDGRFDLVTSSLKPPSPVRDKMEHFYDALEEAVDSTVDQAGNFLHSASLPLSDYQKGIASWQRIIGVELETLVLNPYHCRYALVNPNCGIPNFIEECLTQIVAAADTPQLFRSHVPQSIVRKFARHIEKNHSSISSYENCDSDINTFDLYFRFIVYFLEELPEPLLTSEKYDAFVACNQLDPISSNNSADKENMRVKNLSCLLADLPSLHRVLFVRLFRALFTICGPDHVLSNSLSAAHVSIILAPALIRPGVPANKRKNKRNKSIVLNQNMRLAAIGAGIVEDMISHYPLISVFLEKEISVEQQVVEHRENQINSLINAKEQKMSLSSFLDRQLVKDDEKSLRDILFAHETPNLIFEKYGLPQNMLSDENSYTLLFWQCFNFLLRNHTTKALKVMQDQAKRFDSLSFWSFYDEIVVILLELLSLNDGKIDVVEFSLSSSHWKVVSSSPDFFFDFYSFFFLLFEFNWQESKARTVQHIPEVLLHTKIQVLWMLNKHPTSVRDIWNIWDNVKTTYQYRPSSRYRRSSSGSSANSSEWKQERNTPFPILPYLNEEKDLKIRMLDVSKILATAHISQLESVLPISAQGYDWKLLYSIENNGASLYSLLTKVKGFAPTLLVLRAEDGTICGSFVSDVWHISTKYCGNGQTFLFSFNKTTNCLIKYEWSQQNTYFLLCSEDSFAIGGGGGFGLFLDADLRCGTSGYCRTFNSHPLVDGQDFLCAELEIWGFLPSI